MEEQQQKIVCDAAVSSVPSSEQRSLGPTTRGAQSHCCGDLSRYEVEIGPSRANERECRGRGYDLTFEALTDARWSLVDLERSRENGDVQGL